jgi:hypothetical protein
LTEVSEAADLLDEAANARWIMIRLPTRLLDTPGGGGYLALKGGIHA